MQPVQADKPTTSNIPQPRQGLENQKELKVTSHCDNSELGCGHSVVASKSFFVDTILSGAECNGWQFGIARDDSFMPMESSGPTEHQGQVFPAIARVGANNGTFFKNTTHQTVAPWYNKIHLGPGMLTTHPWEKTDTVIQWTASFAGLITFEVRAAMADDGHNIVSIWRNGQRLDNDRDLKGRGASTHRIHELPVQVGDRLWVRTRIVGLSCNQMFVEAIVTRLDRPPHPEAHQHANQMSLEDKLQQQTEAIRVLEDRLRNLEDKSQQPAEDGPAPAAPTIGVGSRVRVKGSATNYSTGQKIPGWVKSQTYTVQQLRPEKALLKEIFSWVKLCDLSLA